MEWKKQLLYWINLLAACNNKYCVHFKTMQVYHHVDNVFACFYCNLIVFVFIKYTILACPPLSVKLFSEPILDHQYYQLDHLEKICEALINMK